jgi:DNA-binding SARP family transcriptional activator
MGTAQERMELSRLTLEFKCLGSFSFNGSAGWVSGPTGGRGGELLRYFASYPRAAVSPEALYEILWPDSDADGNAHRLHLSVSRARSVLRGVCGTVNPIVFANRSYSWHPRITVRRDADHFEQCFHDGSEAALMRGVATYSGAFLTGESADWVTPLRIRYEHMFLSMLERLAMRAYESKDHTRAIGYAHDIVAVDRAHERATQLAMICLAKTGQRAFAIKEFDSLKLYLYKWLGVAPLQETERLRRQILDGHVEDLEFI